MWKPGENEKGMKTQQPKAQGSKAATFSSEAGQESRLHPEEALRSVLRNQQPRSRNP
jgi:hypothetical protein